MDKKISTLTELLERYDNTVNESDAELFFIYVSIKGYPKPETIVNPLENMEKKIEYIKSTYNEDLTHKFSPDVKIVGYYTI